MRRVVTACLVLALTGPSLSQGSAPRAVTGAAGMAAQVALDTIVQQIDRVSCAKPEVWNVDGDVEGAARFLVGELEGRGWAVMQHGSSGRTYAIIADPDPNDPEAVAVGGLLLDPVEKGRSVAFLATCRMTQEEPVGLYTLATPGIRAGA